MKTDFLFVKIILILVASVLLQACFMKGEIKSANSQAGSDVSFAGAKSLTYISGTAIQINWDLSTDSSVIEYKIYTASSDSTLTLIGTSNASTNFFVHSNLTSGTLYRYVVRLTTSAGFNDLNLNIVNGIPYYGLLSTSVVDATTADLYFSAAPEATGLIIYCSTSGSETMTAYANLSSLTANHRLTGLTTGTLYTCKVKAVLPSGGEDSNTVVSSFTPVNVITSPLGFNGLSSATNTNGTTVELQWLAATPDSGTTLSQYKIFQTNPDSSIDLIDVASNLTNKTITGLIPNSYYSFLARAINASDSSTDGNLIIKSVFMYAGITSITAITSNSATLNFAAASNALNFHIYCYESSGSQPSTPTASISSSLTSYTITSFASATNYTCLIKAVGTNGEDGNTATSSFTTL